MSRLDSSSPRTRLRRSTLAVAYGAALIVGALTAHAQEDSSEVYVLPPMTVNTSEGYLSKNSFAVGRLGGDAKSSGVAASVLTEDFIDDVGALSFNEAISWAPNAVPAYEYEGQQDFNEFRINFRSLGSGFQARNYFLWYNNSDFYNTDRIDVARGPNSVVFGDAGVGGMANVNTKRAQLTDTTGIDTTFFSEGGQRIALDRDQKITDELGVRLGLLYHREAGWRDFQRSDRDGFFITTGWTPVEGLRVDVEFEWGYTERVFSISPIQIYNDWSNYTLSDPLARRDDLPASATGLAIEGNKLVFNPSREDLGVLNYKGWGRTEGTLNDVSLTPRAWPFQKNEKLTTPLTVRYWGWQLNPPNKFSSTDFWSYSAFVNYNFTENLGAEVAFNQQHRRLSVDTSFFTAIWVDPNEYLPAAGVFEPAVGSKGEANPYLRQRYSEQTPSRQDQENDVDEVRVALAYRLDLVDWWKPRFLASTGFRQEDFYSDNYEFAWLNNPAARNYENGDNEVFIRRYESDRDDDYSLPEDSLGRDFGWYKTTDSFIREQKTVGNVLVANVSEWFEQRLTTMVSYRIDEFSREVGTYIQDPVTRAVTGETIGLRRGSEILPGETDNLTRRTFNTNGVYKVWGDYLSLGANYGESFFPAGVNYDLNGEPIGIYFSRGYDLSVRSELLDGKVSLSLTYYNNNQENTISAINPIPSINSVWAALESFARTQKENALKRGDTAGVARFTALEAELDDRALFASGQETIEFEGTGWEFEVTANPRAGLSILANISFPETESISGLEKSASYWAENRDEALAYFPLVTNPSDGRPFLTQQSNFNRAVAQADNRVAFQAGDPLIDTFDYVGSFFAKYTFQPDDIPFLAGFGIGAGVRARGERIAQKRLDKFGGGYSVAPAYETYNLVLSYEREWRNTKWNFQINVDNLFDDEIRLPSPGSYGRYTLATGETVWLPGFYHILDPRSLRFSVSVKF